MHAPCCWWGYVHCLLCAGGYVVSLFVLVPEQVRKLPRDHELHVKYRVRAAGLATMMVIAACAYEFPRSLQRNTTPDVSFFDLFGLRLDSLPESVVTALLLMCVFYSGPILTTAVHLSTKCLYEIKFNGMTAKRAALVSPLVVLKEYASHELLDATESNWILFRNLIFAPISEEVVFRAAMIPVLFHLALASSAAVDGTITPKAVLTSALLTTSHRLWLAAGSTLWFGLAHVHHTLERIRGGQPVVSALMGTLVQVSYTSIFGFIAAVLFMRTGNMAAPIVSHMFCNFMGLPNVQFLHAPGTAHASPMSALYRVRIPLLAAHLLGLSLFAWLLFPITEAMSKRSIYWG